MQVGDCLAFVLRRMKGDKATVAISSALLLVSLGAGLAVLCLAYGLLWKPLHYPDQDRLVSLSLYSKKMGMELGWPPPFIYNGNLERLENVAVYKEGQVAIERDGGGSVPSTRSVEASPEIFEILEPRVIAGRAIKAEDAEPAAPAVAVLGEVLAKSIFGQDVSASIGKRLIISGQATRVVGVVAREASFPSKAVQVWIPLFIPLEKRELSNAGSFGGPKLVAKLKQHAQAKSIESAINETLNRNAVLRKISSDIDLSVRVKPLRTIWTEDRSSGIYALLAAVTAILLITSANLCNLFALRQLRRSHEYALISVFGATSWRKLYYVAAEASLQVLMGAVLVVAAFPVFWSGLDSLGFLPKDYPGTISLEAPVIAGMAAFAAALACTMTLSGWIALGRTEIFETVRQSGKGLGGISAASKRLRSALVIVQLTATLPLVYCTILLSMSEYNLIHQDLGLDPSKRLVAVLEAKTQDDSPAEVERIRGQLYNVSKNIAQVRGDNASAFMASAPLSDIVSVEPAQVGATGSDVLQATENVYGNFVSAGYFDVLGIKLKLGRKFTDLEASDSARVVIVDDVFAKKNYPDGNPVGRSIGFADASGVMQQHQIIGVVSHSRQRELARDDDYASVYRPAATPYGLEAIPSGAVELVVSSSDAKWLSSVLAKQAPDVKVADLRPLQERLTSSIVDRININNTLSFLVVVALALVGVGLYSSFTNLILVRLREFGVRKALGQSDLGIFSLILKGAFSLMGVACCAGVPLSLFIAVMLSERLFKVSPIDIPTIAALLSICAFVVLAATGLPALRASRSNPIEALRHD